MTDFRTAISDFVRRMGGSIQLSVALNLTASSSVRNWSVRGAIPLRHHLALTRLAAAHGIELDDRLFEQPAKVEATCNGHGGNRGLEVSGASSLARAESGAQ
jgi:hypothetical protein